MKKLLTLQLLTLSSLYAGMFSTVSGMTMKEIDPDYTYTIDTAGFNPRVYEFTPKSNPNKVCVIVFGNAENGAVIPAMQCFDKRLKGEN